MPKPHTAIRERGSRLSSLPRVSHNWPEFLVSAPHVRSGAPEPDAPAVPAGVWHARQVGSLTSACGMSAVTWRFFWTLSFIESETAACAECVRVVRSQRVLSHDRSSA